MNNYAKFYFTEKELLEKVGFNKDTSVISNIKFDQECGDIEITVRSSEEIKGVTGKTGNVRRTKLFNETDNGKTWREVVLNSYNITYYEDLGYKVPRFDGKVKNGTKILVKIEDIPTESKLHNENKTINITINTHGCKDESSEEFLEKFIKGIKKLGSDI